MYYTDEPITKPEEDAFGREIFVNNLANDINRWSGLGSLVLALYGPWGTGKSSVLNLLQKKIEDEKSSEVIAFDPWYFNSTEQLIQTFFTIVKNKTVSLANNEDAKSKLSDAFRRYSASLSQVVTWEPTLELPGGFKINLSGATKTKHEPESPEKVRGVLRQALGKIKRKFIVFIDNLDRLDSPELMLMFKLVRLCSDFPNFIFVLAFDHKQVSRLVTSQGVDPDFLEKIIQIDIELPLIDQNDIDNFIRASFQSLINTLKLRLSQQSWDRFAQIYDQVLSGYLINNLRTAKRYLNSVSFTIPIVREEVDFADFLVLEAIRVFFPTIYSGLSNYKKDLTSFESTYGLDAMRRIRLAEDQAIRDWIAQELSNKDDVKVCERLIGFLFPSVGAFFQNPTNPQVVTREDVHLANQRICAVEYFDMYFKFRLPKGELSSKVLNIIEDSLNSDNVPIEEVSAIILSEKERLGPILTKLNYRVNSINLTGRLALIKTLGTLGQELEWELFDNRWNASGPSAARLTIKCFQTVDRSDELWTVVCDVVSSTPSLPFACELIRRFLSDDPPYQIAQQKRQEDEEKLRSIIVKRLQDEILTPKQNIFDVYPTSYHRLLTVLRSEKIMGTREIGTNYVYEQLLTDPNALPKMLITNATFNLPTYTIHSFEFDRLKNDYDVDKLYEILVSQESTANYSQIEQEAINAFKKFVIAKNTKSDAANENNTEQKEGSEQ